MIMSFIQNIVFLLLIVPLYPVRFIKNALKLRKIVKQTISSMSPDSIYQWWSGALFEIRTVPLSRQIILSAEINGIGAGKNLCCHCQAVYEGFGNYIVPKLQDLEVQDLQIGKNFISTFFLSKKEQKILGDFCVRHLNRCLTLYAEDLKKLCQSSSSQRCTKYIQLDFAFDRASVGINNIDANRKLSSYLRGQESQNGKASVKTGPAVFGKR